MVDQPEGQKLNPSHSMLRIKVPFSKEFAISLEKYGETCPEDRGRIDQ